MGFSQGARAALKIIKDYPTFFKAAVVISNYPQGVFTWTGSDYKSVPIHMYVGTEESDFYSGMYSFMTEVNNAGGNVTLQQINGNHATISYSLPYDDIFSWFLQH